MIRETKKIFHDDTLQVVPTTIRVPVFRAHSEALYVEVEKQVSLDQVRSVLDGAPGVRLVDDRQKNYFPMPIEASHGDDILVGRLRRDPANSKGWALFVSGDQLTKGAALNAVQIAEIWARKPS